MKRPKRSTSACRARRRGGGRGIPGERAQRGADGACRDGDGEIVRAGHAEHAEADEQNVRRHDRENLLQHRAEDEAGEASPASAGIRTCISVSDCIQAVDQRQRRAARDAIDRGGWHIEKARPTKRGFEAEAIEQRARHGATRAVGELIEGAAGAQGWPKAPTRMAVTLRGDMLSSGRSADDGAGFGVREEIE